MTKAKPESEKSKEAEEKPAERPKFIEEDRKAARKEMLRRAGRPTERDIAERLRDRHFESSGWD